VQHSRFRSNLFYCSDNVDLAKRDAAFFLFRLFFLGSYMESSDRGRKKTCLLPVFGTSGAKVERCVMVSA
jgi:hypothetical protein